MRSSAVTVLAVGAGSALAACSTDANPGATSTSSAAPAGTRYAAGDELRGDPPNSEDVVVIPEGYRQKVVISWGTPSCQGRRCSTSTRRPARPSVSSSASTRLRGPAPSRPGQSLPAGDQPRVRDAAVHVPRLQPGRTDPRSSSNRDRLEGLTVVEVERGPDGLRPVMGATTVGSPPTLR